MPIKIESLVVDLVADTGKFRSGLSGALRSVRNFGRNLAVGIAAAGTATSFFLGRQISQIDELAKISRRIGISTEALSQYRFVAEQGGVSFNTLTTALQRFSRRLSDAANDTGPAAAAFEELRLDADRLAQLPLDRAFERTATALDNLTDSNRKVALAQKIFDSEGVRLIQIMEGGAQAIRRTRGEADAFGLTVTENLARRTEATTDAIGKFQASFRGLSLAILQEVLPSFQSFVQNMSTELPSFVRIAGLSFRLVGAIVRDFAAQIEPLLERASESISGVLNAVGGAEGLSAGVGRFGRFLAQVPFALGGTAAVVGSFLRGDFRGGSGLAQELFSSPLSTFRDQAELLEINRRMLEEQRQTNRNTREFLVIRNPPATAG